MNENKVVDAKIFDSVETAWCPGCGNFAIQAALKQALAELGLLPHEVVITSGIGQAAKMPHYVRTNGFNGLHGRALPPAFGIHVANKNLKVIVSTGDGDSFGEGGNHVIHNMRRNIDIAHFVHDNQIYGLTKGQASPTTSRGHKTSVQVEGVINKPLNPIALSIVSGATFVARAYAGNRNHLVSVMKEAIQHRGYALVDIMQPCVTFNKVNTYEWFNERVYMISEDHDRTNRLAALEMAFEWEDADKVALGIFYQVEQPTYIDKIPKLSEGCALVDREPDMEKVEKFIEEFM